MKSNRFVFSMLFFFNLSAFAFAQEFNFGFNSGKMPNVASMNTFGTQFNVENMLWDDPEIISIDKKIVFDIGKPKTATYKADPWASWLMNFAVGLGVGSYAQGDIVGGIIGTTGELGGMGLIFGAAFAKNQNASLGMVISGLIVFLGTRIFENIRPWTYE